MVGVSEFRSFLARNWWIQVMGGVLNKIVFWTSMWFGTAHIRIDNLMCKWLLCQEWAMMDSRALLGWWDMNFLPCVKSADREKDFWFQREKIFHGLLPEHKMLYCQPNSVLYFKKFVLGICFFLMIYCKMKNAISTNLYSKSKCLL